MSQIDKISLKQPGVVKLAAEQKPFEAVLKENQFTSGLDQMFKDFKTQESKFDNQLKNFDGPMAELLSIQRSMQKIHLTTELITKSGDAVMGSARRLQQMGSG